MLPELLLVCLGLQGAVYWTATDNVKTCERVRGSEVDTCLCKGGARQSYCVAKNVVACAELQKSDMRVSTYLT